MLNEKKINSKRENSLGKYLLEEEGTATDDVGTTVVLGWTTTTDAENKRDKYIGMEISL